MSELETGDKAPEFCLPDQDGRRRCLSDYKGRYVVVYFYPKDNSSGCTTEAQAFTASLPEFEKAGAPIIGISPDSPESHRGFAERQGLKIALLSDQKHEVMEAYGVWRKKSMYGKEHMGVERSTFIIDPSGRVARAWRKVRAAGHAEMVLAELKELVGKG